MYQKQINMRENLKDELFATLKEDYIGFWMIYSIVKDFNPEFSRETLINEVIDTIKHLCNTDGIMVGEMQEKSDGKVYFNEWFFSPEEKFSRIHLEWKKIDFKEPDIGDIEIYFAFK